MGSLVRAQEREQKPPQGGFLVLQVSHSSEYDSVDVAHINYLVYTNKINEYANIVVIYKFEKKGNIYVIGFWRPIDGGHARIEYSYRKKKLSILAHECGAI
jgi:hypothetical protein